MVSQVKTVVFAGVDPVEITVECHMTNMLQNMVIVGLPDKTIAESRERIRCALNSLSMDLPEKRIIVNLAPADVLKEGSAFDLPIILALFIEMGIIPASVGREYLSIGELSLDGTIRAVSGALPAKIFSNSINMGLICPYDNGAEAYWAGGDYDTITPKDLSSLVSHLKGHTSIPKFSTHEVETMMQDTEISGSSKNFLDVKGNASAKRAMEIAAAGGHNLLMSGPPGSGKSMLASRFNTILPKMSPEEAIETTIIYSISGKLPNGSVIINRPYRDPHHSSSPVSIAGGGRVIQPGEISLAHNGVLFFDELPEFPSSVIEILRQPIETGYINISRAHSHVTYPADFQFIAAMNPCKCGYFGITSKECNKVPLCSQDYMKRISGPILDRIDLFVNVNHTPIEQLRNSNQSEESSEDIQKRVIQARKIQAERYKDLHKIGLNKHVEGELLESLDMTKEARIFLNKAIREIDISMRGYAKILRVSRTIADLANSDSIEESHVAESIFYKLN